MEKKIVANNDNIKKIVNSEIERLGNKADLNHIDVSGVTNMEFLFDESSFNGDISNWNVGKVKEMRFMFQYSKFNQDISRWDVGNVRNMYGMFSNSKFNQDISNWNVGNVWNMGDMFYYSQFNQDISNWDVSNVENMNYMFYNSQFNQDISKWNINLKILKEVPLNFDNKAVDNNNFLLLLFNSFEYKNKIKFNNLSRKVYINHIRKRLKT